jgi:hypothetical protein
MWVQFLSGHNFYLGTTFIWVQRMTVLQRHPPAPNDSLPGRIGRAIIAASASHNLRQIHCASLDRAMA